MDSIPITPEIIQAHKLTMEEYQLICQYIGREPNFTELGIFSAMWSEHCGYKNTKPLLKKLPTKGDRIIFGPGENAGVVDFGDKDAVVFKIESHNHPSAIEPYQGAATGVGGILRDIFTMGARPIAILDSLRFGNIEAEKTKHLLDGVVRGIAGYGNCVGIPTVGGETFFEETYNQNILVNAMCIGLTKKNKIVTSVASGVGNYLVYYGATTGRDGVHGASFASAKLEEAEELKSAIQVGDPFLEKLLLEATLELIEKNLIIAAQDMGAAGLTSSSTEMGTKGGNGVRLVLDNIPKRVSDLTPYEMLLSESQERMLALIAPEKWEKVKKILDKWGIHGVIVGEIIEPKKFIVTYKNETVVDLPLDAIVEKVPLYTRQVVHKPSYFEKLKPVVLHRAVSLEEGLKTLLASPNIASKHFIYEQYDHMIGNNTVLRPGVAGASIVRIPGKKKGVVVTTDCNSRYVYLNPEEGTKIAVAEAARNIVAVGGKPIAITNNLNFGTPTDLDVYYQLYYSIEGMRKACLALGTPVTGGNVSLYNEGKYGSIYPTPVIGMIGIIDNVKKQMTPSFKEAGDSIIVVGKTREEIDGSEFARVFFQQLGKECPIISLKTEKKIQNAIAKLIKKEWVKSVEDISLGGLLTTLAKCAIKGKKSCDIKIETEISREAYLFGESQSRFIITVDPKKEKKVLKFLNKKNITYTVIGKVTDASQMHITFNQEKASINMQELIDIYYHSFEKKLVS